MAAPGLLEPGMLSEAPVIEFQDCAAVAARGGFAVLPWRSAWLAAVVAGIACGGDADAAPPRFAQAVVHVQKGRDATRADLAAAWRRLESDGRLVVCGPNRLGIATVLARLGDEIGQEPRALVSRGHGRIGAFMRSARALPPPSPPPPVHMRVPGIGRIELATSPGLFSVDAIDPGTALLVAELAAAKPPPRRVLDLACGAGPLAIAALLMWPQATAVLADADARAVSCARSNLERLQLDSRAQVAWWDASEPLPAGEFDLILANPPAHTGALVDLGPARAMLRGLVPRLSTGGRALVVANRKLPYEAALNGRVRVLRQEAGFKILEVTHE